MGDRLGSSYATDLETIGVSLMSMRSPIPYTHDLLLVKSMTIEEACIAEPAWVRPAVAKYPWAVVRRAVSPKNRIAVGVRGQERQQRWGGFVRKDQIVKAIAPWHLRSGLANTVRLSLPAMQSLCFLEIELASLSNDWGPGGSVGYELASRAPVVTQGSDLDLVVSAPDRFDRDFAQHLWKKIALAPAKVDVRIETLWCGFSLEEYVRGNSEKLLVRTSTGPRLTTDPWTQRVGGNE
jgi:phosphoribosyl-dephospho-CoA transferase